MELPHKLMISIAVLALILPVVLESVEITKNNIAEQELKNQCEYLANNIILLYYQGTGAVKKLELELPQNTDYVLAGAPIDNTIGPDLKSIRYKIKGSIVQRELVGNGLVHIPMCSEFNGTFSITTGGFHTIRLEKHEIDIDLNGDGLRPDHYIMISIV